MADRELTINLTLKKNLAETAAKEFHAAEKQRMTKSLTDHEVIEKGKTAFTRRENQQRINEVAKFFKTEGEQAKEAADKRKRADAEAARAKIAGDKAINAAQRQAAQDQIRQAREVARENARLDKEWKARLKANAQEARAERKLQAAENKAWNKDAVDGWKGQEAAIGNAGVALTSFAGQFAGLVTVSKVVGEIEASFQRTRDAIFNGSELLGEFRLGLLELAALKDHAGDTTQEAMETLKLQAKTGQKTEDVKALQLSFLGTAESVVGPNKKLTNEEAQKAMEGVGVIAATHGGGAGQWGGMAGMVAQTMKPANGKQLTGAEVAEETAAMYAISRPAKFASIDAGAKQFSKVQGLVQNGVISAREGMGLVSAFGSVEEETAGQRVNQFTRLTMGGSTKDAHGRIIPMKGVDAESQAAYQARLGITEKMGPAERGKIMAADFDKVEKETLARGEGFNPIAYAKTVGMNNEGERNAFFGFRGMLNKGILGTFEGLANNPNLGKGEINDARTALAVDPGLQRQMAKSGEELSKMMPGIKGERMKNIRHLAYNDLNKAGGMSEFEDIEKKGWYSPTDFISGERAAIDRRTQEMVMAAGDKLGIPYATSTIGGGPNGQKGKTIISDEEQERVVREAQSRGYSFGGDANDKLTQAANTQLEAARVNLEAAKLRANPRPVAMPGKPNQPAARAAGGPAF